MRLAEIAGLSFALSILIPAGLFVLLRARGRETDELAFVNVVTCISFLIG
jgi:hypothetical protein